MHALLQSVPPTPCLYRRLLDTQRQVSCGVTVPFSWVLVHWVLVHKFLLCPPGVYFPVLCKFWQLHGGVIGVLLQEDLCHTHTQSPCPCSRPMLPCTPQEILKHSSVSVSVGFLGPGVHKYVWALWASLARMRFDSKCEFAPPTIFLGLLPCPWRRGISSQLLQGLLSYWGFSDLGHGVSIHGCSREVQALLLTLNVGNLLSAAGCSSAAQPLSLSLSFLLNGFPSSSNDKKKIFLYCWRSGFNPWVVKIPWRMA